MKAGRAAGAEGLKQSPPPRQHQAGGSGSEVLYLILFVIAGTLVFVIGNLILVRKFYWGPGKRPPQKPAGKRTPARRKP